MGYRGSWMAFADIDKAEVLSRLSLRDTEVQDESGIEPFVGGVTAAGWYVVLACEAELEMDFDLPKLSAGCRLIGVDINEVVMTSWAQSFEDGKQQWEVMHIGNEGLFDLHAEGNLPPEFAEIRQQAIDEQTAEGGEEAGVDYVYEIPLDTAAAVCGFKHDGSNLDMGEAEPALTILEKV